MMVTGGYQPIKGKLDKSNPPKGGTGVKENILHLESLKKVNLKKDDVIIFNLKQNIPNEAIQRITKQLKQTFPDNKAVVLCNGVDLSIIRKKNYLPKANPKDDETIF